MGKFLEDEKQRLTVFKSTSPYFSNAARADGKYRHKSRPFCLPRECAEENLFHEIRQSIKEYFSKAKIKWHDGQDLNPSNHLCDSQVCCANFLFPFADKPHALAELLRPIYPSIHRMLPMEDNIYVAFEWIGPKNYLNERSHVRGANCTSADAAVMFKGEHCEKQIVLIEWKYTETYSRTSFLRGKSGEVRRKTYFLFYEWEDFPVNKKLLPSFDELFYEPFYQLMRQQLLANEMEKSQEKEAQEVSVLHIEPEHNAGFGRVTSPELCRNFPGQSVNTIWKKLMIKPNRFKNINTEKLFRKFPIKKFPELVPWWEYITLRYPWIQTID